MDTEFELPTSPRNHVLQRLSEIYFNAKFPSHWIVNPFIKDYGTDYNCEIVKNTGVTGINFTIQLKGKEADADKDDVVVRVKRTTINRWNNRLEPTMIIIYLENEQEAYWKWLSDEKIDLTKPNDTFAIRIKRDNKLSTIDWESVSDYLTTIFSRKNLLYQMPEVTSESKRAWDLYFKQEYSTALPMLRKIASTESSGEIWNAIAVCQYRLFHYQDGIISINKALSFGENFVLLSNKAAILTEQGFLTGDDGKIEQSLEVYHKVLYYREAAETTHYNLGSALTKLKRYGEALVQFEKALEMNPNKPEIWNNLGNVYMHLNDHVNEMICYDNALLLNPNLAETLFSKGSSLFKNLGMVDEGLELMLRASERTDRYEYDFPYLFWWVSHAYLYKNDITNARKWNSMGLETFSTDPYLLEQKHELDNY